MIITHRGHYKNLQENTIAAFETALKAGADAVECDLRLTLDNQVVVYHDNHLALDEKQFKISQTPLKNLIPILTIDNLFDYIGQKRVPFFLETKNKSPILVENIVKKISEKNLWEKVHIIGFSHLIKNALYAQAKYEKLRVLPIINLPLYSYIKIPSKSYGVFIGWIDKWYGSEWLFRKLMSVGRLIKLKEFYEKNGFKVMAGVINSASAFNYFEQAGIVDVVTDNIHDAVGYFKTGHPELVSGSHKILK